MARNRLYEFVTFDGQNEADDPQNQPQAGPEMGGAPQPAPGQADVPMQDMNGGMPPMDNAVPQGGEQMPPMDNAMPPMDGQQPPMEIPADDQMDVTGGMDLPDANYDGADIEDIDMDGVGPNDEVIDVDDLTQSQEAAEYKIDGVDEKLTTLGAVVSKFIEALKQNDSKIDDLKAEFEKRVPTEEERLNLRSVSSVPYMQTPGEYWSNKIEQNPRYNVMHDNTIAPKDEQKEFELRKSDLAGIDDRTIADSFDYPTNLKDILDF